MDTGEKKKENKGENARLRFEDLIVMWDMVTKGFDGGPVV